MPGLDVDQLPFVEAAHHGGRRADTRLFVVHTAETDEGPTAAEGVANFFHNTDRNASTQLTVDEDSAVLCVDHDDVCYGAGDPQNLANGHGYHAELAGRAGQSIEEWADPASQMTLVNAARLFRQLRERRYPNIRPVHLDADAILRGERDGFTGHVDIETAFYPNPQRSDPGPDFPWDLFLEMVSGQPSAADLTAFFNLLALLEAIEMNKEQDDRLKNVETGLGGIVAQFGPQGAVEDIKGRIDQLDEKLDQLLAK